MTKSDDAELQETSAHLSGRTKSSIHPTVKVELTTILSSPTHQDLHLDASNNLCELFMKLLEQSSRREIVLALNQVPGSWDRLFKFIHSQTCGWRLRVIEGWLIEQKK